MAKVGFSTVQSIYSKGNKKNTKLALIFYYIINTLKETQRIFKGAHTSAVKNFKKS